MIPGASFQMGCVSGLDCDDDEKPVHEVTVASFELSKYEVTFEEYDCFIAATGRISPKDQGWGRGRRPVINVSWEDANSLHGVAVGADGGALPAAERGGMGVCGPGRDRRRSIIGGTTLPIWPHGNHGRATCDGMRQFSGTMRRRRRWVRLPPQRLWTSRHARQLCGSGCRIAGTAVIRGRRRMARPGPAATVRNACCAAVPGMQPTRIYLRAAIRGRYSTGRSVPTSSVSVWPGRSPLESLTLYLGGPGGWPPGVLFCSA